MEIRTCTNSKINDLTIVWDGCILTMLWVRDYKCKEKNAHYLLLRFKDTLSRWKVIPVFSFSPDSGSYIESYGLNFSQIRYIVISLWERKWKFRSHFNLSSFFKLHLQKQHRHNQLVALAFRKAPFHCPNVHWRFYLFILGHGYTMTFYFRFCRCLRTSIYFSF